MFKFKNYDFKRYNYTMLLVVLILGIIGSFLILQVEKEGENLYSKQIMGIVGGLLMVIVISLIDYHFICKFYIVLYFINLALLVLVRTHGFVLNNAKRWINLVYFQFQPSEISKIIMILFMAKLFILFKDKINKAWVLLIAVFTLMLPISLILTQPDLSTSMVIMFIFVMMLFAAGLSWKIILPVIAVGAPSVIALFWYIQQDYQKLLSPAQQKRVLSILHPELYQDIMFQQDNSIQAIGSGQLFGKRFVETASEIRGYRFVPISESDFIFSVAGEEFGFIGSCIIIALFAIIVYKCLVTAKKAPDQLGRLIATGIASMFMFQVFVNIGVATALLPNTGIPLPFLSSGLSSLMSSMIAIGIILNIRLQPKKAKR